MNEDARKKKKIEQQHLNINSVHLGKILLNKMRQKRADNDKR